jgi:hypothetical protein
MLHEIFEAKCGILFDVKGLDYLKVPYDCVPRDRMPLIPTKSRISSDSITINEKEPSKGNGVEDILTWKEADRLDAAAKLHDMLKSNLLWRFLQVPCWTGRRIDWTGQRRFPENKTRKDNSRIHWTVTERKKSVKGYEPNASLPKGWENTLVSDDARGSV